MDKKITARLRSLNISEDDLEETYVRGTGKGGQKRNKTSSAVVLVHIPSGIRVRCEDERTQAINRIRARELLCEKLEALRNRELQEKKSLAAKERRQKAKRSVATKRKILVGKRLAGEKKRLRRRPEAE